MKYVQKQRVDVETPHVICAQRINFDTENPHEIQAQRSIEF